MILGKTSSAVNGASGDRNVEGEKSGCVGAEAENAPEIIDIDDRNRGSTSKGQDTECSVNSESGIRDSELTVDEGGDGKTNGSNGEGKTGNGGDSGSALRGELAAERDRYLRLAAEYDNFRKRNAKEREKIYNDARAEAIKQLLPVYDNLERALKMECADEAFYKGVEMTLTQLTGILENMDVQPILAVGEPFDPNHHYAVMTIENPELGEKVVAEEFQRGFMLGDRVIRHSTVVVAN